MSKGTSIRKKNGSEAPRRKAAAVAAATEVRGRATTAEVRRIPRDDIARRAYELFLARGAQHGDDLADWFHAEAELQSLRGDRAGRS